MLGYFYLETIEQIINIICSIVVLIFLLLSHIPLVLFRGRVSSISKVTMITCFHENVGSMMTVNANLSPASILKREYAIPIDQAVAHRVRSIYRGVIARDPEPGDDDGTGISEFLRRFRNVRLN